jgi:hypothetical protein
MEAQPSKHQKMRGFHMTIDFQPLATRRIHHTSQLIYLSLFGPSAYVPSIAPGLVGVNKALAWRWNLGFKRPNIQKTRGFHMTIDFQPLLVEFIVLRANKSQ